MSRRPSFRTPSPALLSSTASLRGWFVHLVPLAVVALLGCAEDKVALGIDASSSSGEDTAADDTAADDTADDTATGDTAGPVVPDGEPIAELASECELRFSCDCTHDRFADIAACEEHYMVEWAGILGKAEAAGLTADLECYLGSLPYANYACASGTEYSEQASQDPPACSSCQFAYGDRQVGQSCQAFDDGVGDCAQGLLCVSVAGVSQCADPCSHAGVGESCSYLPCADGLACDWLDATCRATGGEGELCADGLCDDGLMCHWNSNTCKQAVGLGEACKDHPCAPGLFCDGEVCVAPPGPGESCEVFACADGLVCQWEDMTCATPGQEGESCSGKECAPGLFCDATLVTCVPPGSLGESCGGRPCMEGIACDWQTLTCAPIPGLGEPCSDVCTGDLVCNFDASPTVCAALPVAGEPCIWGSCAANFICDYETQHCVDEPSIVCGL